MEIWKMEILKNENLEKFKYGNVQIWKEGNQEKLKWQKKEI